MPAVRMGRGRRESHRWVRKKLFRDLTNGNIFAGERAGRGRGVDIVLDVGAGAKPGTVQSDHLSGGKDRVCSQHYVPR